MAKHDLKLKSIYEVLKYDKDLIDFSLTLFKGSSYENLLIRHYGKKYDGIGSLRDLSFQEKERLDTTLTILEERLEAMNYLKNDGKSMLDIKNMFKGKSDSVITSVISSVKNTHKKQIITHFTSKNKLLAYYEITESELEDACELILNQDARLAFKYTYGVGCNVMDSNSILALLDDDYKSYQELLKIAEQNLPDYIKQIKSEDKIIKPIITLKNNEKIQKKINSNIKKEDTKIPIKNKTEKKKPGKDRPQYFIEYFYKEDTSLEQKQIEDKLFKIFEFLKNRNNNAYIVATKLYGEDLKSECSNAILDDKDVNLFNYFKAEARKKLNYMIENNLSYIEEKTSIEEKTRKMYTESKKYFLDYIYEDNMSLEEKEKIKVRVKNILQAKANSSKKTYKLIQKLYGEDCMQERTDYYMTQSERSQFYHFRIDTKDLALGKKKLMTHVPSYFKEYFYTIDMTDADKKNMDLLVSNAISFLNQKNKYFKDTQKLYGEDLNNKINENIKITKELTNSLAITKRKVSLIIDSDEKDININTNKYKTYFMDYIYEDNMSLKEKEKIKVKVLNLLQLKSSRLKDSYEVVQKLYGEDCMQEKKDVYLSCKEKKLFNYILNETKEASLEKKSVRIINPCYFNEYFYTIDMTDSDKHEMDELISKALLYINKDSLYYKNMQKVYGKNLDNKINEKVKIDKYHIQNMRKTLNSIIEDIKDNKLDNNIQKKRKFNYLIDYILSDKKITMSKEEIESVMDKAILTLKQKNLAYYQAASFVFGEDLKGKNSGIILNSKENSNFYYFIKNIKIYMEKLQLSNKENLEKIKEDKIEIKHKIGQKEKTIVEVKKEVDSNNVLSKELRVPFMDKLIYDAYHIYYDSNLIKAKLQIDDDTLIQSYLTCLEYYEEKDEIISYILLHYPNRINEILSCPYFSKLSVSLSEEEKEVIYLKLVAINNPNITDGYISRITGIDLDTIISYQIMTKSDCINSINQYIKK